MPTAADIQKAAERIRNGTDAIGSIMRLKRAAQEALKSGNVAHSKAAGYTLLPMKPQAPKIDWPRVVQQMAADKARLEAAIEGDQQARQQVTFVHPLAVPAK